MMFNILTWENGIVFSVLCFGFTVGTMYMKNIKQIAENNETNKEILVEIKEIRKDSNLQNIEINIIKTDVKYTRQEIAEIKAYTRQEIAEIKNKMEEKIKI